MTKKKEKQKEEDMKEETKDMEHPETESKDQKMVRKKTEKSHPTEHDDGSYEDNKQDMNETKKLVQEAIKDMILEQVKDMGKQIAKDIKEELKEDMAIANEVALNEKNRRLQDIQKTLLKDPYNYEKDFVEGKSLAELESAKSTFEATKAYKDFVATQEDMNKPNKEIFDGIEDSSDIIKNLATNDFSNGGYWGHIYGNKGGK